MIISNNDFGLKRGLIVCPPSQPPGFYYELSHTESLMFTWSEQGCTEIFFIFCSSSVTKILSLMLLCSEFMGLGHGSHTHTNIQMHAHTHSQQSCSASTPCNPSDKLQRLLLLSRPPPPSLTLLSPSSCNWIWIKMAFPFLLYSSLLWLKRDLPGEITQTHI